MIHDDSNPTGAAPARETPRDASGDPPPAILDNVSPSPGNIPEAAMPPPASSQFDASIPEDLHTPWGWKDLLLFIGFGFLALLIAAVIVVSVAVFGFGMRMGDLNQTAAKSIVAVLSQGVWSGFVLLY